MPHFAYVFERFPSFTQTFCAREVLAIESLGADVLIFSIHDVTDEEVQHFPESLRKRVHVLPQEKQLVAAVTELKKANLLPQSVVLTLREWGDQPDKMRVYEAAYIGHQMRLAGVQHAHTHFAGIGARTCWWIKQFYGLTYSFTGHANDLFVDPKLPVTLEHLLRDAAVVVTVSDYTARWLREKSPPNARKVRRVYNGLDLDSITQATEGIHKVDPPLIFSVGRLIEKKGFADLITACGKLRDAGERFQCQIAGEGPLLDELQEQIQTLQLEGHVQLLGAQSQEQIKVSLGQAKIFALPCVTEKEGGKDNLPTVLMEAMAARLPCVSTRLAGVPEMVVSEVTGLLCEERQPEQFALLLQRLLRDPALAKSYGEAGLARARELFAQSVTARELLAYLIAYGDISYPPNLRGKDPLSTWARRCNFFQQWKRRLTRSFQRHAKAAIRP
jgi:colanic acid/amylovoran biosynthesis glycosyltransferase